MPRRERGNRCLYVSETDKNRKVKPFRPSENGRLTFASTQQKKKTTGGSSRATLHTAHKKGESRIEKGRTVKKRFKGKNCRLQRIILLAQGIDGEGGVQKRQSGIREDRKKTKSTCITQGEQPEAVHIIREMGVLEGKVSTR